MCHPIKFVVFTQQLLQNMLDDLRVKVQSLVPSESPFMYQGTGGSWDEEELLRAFVMASIVEVNTAENRYLSQQWFGLGVTAGPGPMFQNSHGAVRAPDTAHGNVYTLKVTKIGLLLRKDDTLEGGRRAMNRKWRPWSMVLTGSQLLFFRDSTFATSFKAQVDSSSGHALVPHTAMPVPDEYLSVRDCIAVFDKSYAKVCVSDLVRDAFDLTRKSARSHLSSRHAGWTSLSVTSPRREGDERVDLPHQLRKRVQDGRCAHACPRHGQ